MEQVAKSGNHALYETDDVVNKYATVSARVRFLNNAEHDFVSRYQVTSKRVLVLGSGAGRVPANLFLLNNDITAVEYSEKLHTYALKQFGERLHGLQFFHGNAEHLEFLEDASFDVVFFPMNGLDYNVPIETREAVLKEISKKLKPDGILAFTSHNTQGYLSYKAPKKRFPLLKKDFIIEEENVVGGGVIFKGKPSFVIRQAERAAGVKYIGFTADARNWFERKAARRLKLAQFVFPYLLYVFRKAKAV
ncbi:class I SAM-dependent methyltransferase [Patescibacteria group bacterium]|nr:class I SAM-dependent methyltransferase [Patescibacteria group bacterium]